MIPDMIVIVMIFTGIVCTAASDSQKGSHQETREMVTYYDDEIFWVLHNTDREMPRHLCSHCVMVFVYTFCWHRDCLWNVRWHYAGIQCNQ